MPSRILDTLAWVCLPGNAEILEAGSVLRMASDVEFGSIPPSPGRVRAAWESGRRSGSRWLEVGIPCLALSLALEMVAPILVGGWGRWFAAGVEGRIDESLSSDLLMFWALVLVVAAGLALLGVAILGNLGAVTRRPLPQLGPIPVPVFAFGGLLLLLTAAAVVSLGPVVAGAARAADASEPSLALLWARWATYSFGAIGVLLIAAGVAEHLIMRHSSWRSLHLSPGQARELAKDRGGSRG